MAICSNCRNRLTCGCQKRVSKNGIAGCSKCIETLNASQPQPKTVSQPESAPKNVGATYNGPGTQI